MPPLVSFCIPAFNAERNIETCLRSVIAQGVADAEIVLVDNASTDRTVELARAVLDGYPNGRIVRNETNIGRVGNWNRCFEVAHGQYIKFAFTNDALIPGATQRLVSLISADPEMVIVGSRQRTVTSIPNQLSPVPVGAAVSVRDGADALEYLASHGFADLGSLNGMIYRRSAVIENEIWYREDIPYFADFAHAIELASIGKVGFLDAETYCFNEGASGRYHFAGLQNIPKFLTEHRLTTSRHMQLLRRHGRKPQTALDYLWGRYFWYLSQGWPIRVKDAFTSFKGHPALQLHAAAKTAWYHLRARAA